ncbi:MAG: hypothetical protein HYT10_00620 [Candidatus Levybacteria bacterium]|nr:hypothetical protein [Candidatus Levybacteria bacterium]
MSQAIIDLDENVLLALNFFTQNPPPQLDVSSFNLPFVVGSGNAYNTGLIIFSEKAAIFADESNFKELIPAFRQAIISGLIKQAVIISASGGKDSVWEIELAKKYGLHTTLLTTKGESDAAKIADNVYVFQSIDEPYTYNVSTYMGMILAATKENTENIKKYIESLSFPKDFGIYQSYSFVLPDKYLHICGMLDIKKDELFGPYLAIRAFSQGHARHAKFVHRSKDELVISIGEKNQYFGDPQHKWDIFPPEPLSFAGIMALTYYIIGKIQKSKPQYFKENISKYVTDYGPKAYGTDKPFDLIVPGSKR